MTARIQTKGSLRWLPEVGDMTLNIPMIYLMEFDGPTKVMFQSSVTSHI